MVSLEQITAAVEKRYDYFSARVIVREALRAASLGEKTSYDAGELNALVEVLPTVGERLDDVINTLQALTGGDGKAPAEAAVEAAAKEVTAEPAAEPVAADPVAEPAPEPEVVVADAVDDAADGDEPEASDESPDTGSKGSKKKKKKK